MKTTENSLPKKKSKQSLLHSLSPASSTKRLEPKKLPTQKKQQHQTESIKQQSIQCNLLFNTNFFHKKLNFSNNSSVQRSIKISQQKNKIFNKKNFAEINSIYLKKNQKESQKIKLSINKSSSKINHNNHHSSKKVKEQIKKSLANIIKIYNPQKKSYLDISMTQVTNDGLAKQQKLLRSDFNFLTVIGEGGYGKVWKVEYFKSRIIYAMKQMSKAVIIMKKSAENVLNQMKILSKLNSPFIANISFAFNDRDNLYLGMDYLPGGDIRSYLNQSPNFRQQDAKFLIACIIKAIQYIHINKIFHRDIKPENLVIDQLGYIRLTDFGIARSEKQKQFLDASGTPSYMAPEVLCKEVHSYTVDLYAVGIIAYELMMGKRPYSGQNRIQIRNAILAKQHILKKQQIPPKWSIQSADFINRLIQRQPNLRLGSKNGIQQLKQHPWLLKYPWKLLEQKKLISPFKTKLLDLNGISKQLECDQTINQYKILQRAEQKVDIFAGYFFNIR